MNTDEQIAGIVAGGIIAALRLEPGQDLTRMAEAICEGGDLLTALPHLKLMPAGGITLESVGNFIRAGAAAVGVEGAGITRGSMAQGEFTEITQRAGGFAEAVRRARGEAGRPVPPVRPIEGPDVR